MIDFSNQPIRKKTYAGANGSKISIMYENEVYMLKFPAFAKKNKDMSYANSCISEYLGCHIFESIGIPVQKTLLGTYTKNGKEKIVVACKDFTSGNTVLQDFASLKNTVIDSENNGYGVELSDITTAMKEQVAFDTQQLSDRFWDMFIVDALIGNWDRHNGNWGFLYNSETDEICLAPIYDCGSSLYPQADEEMMAEVLKNKAERDMRIFEKPLSGIKHNNQKINYFKFISSLNNKDCNNALKRIVPNINMEKINAIIDETPFISEIQKNFYKVMLKERKEHILDFSLEKLLLNEKKKSAPER